MIEPPARDETRGAIQVDALGSGRYRVAGPGGSLRTAWATADAAGTWVFLEGRTYLIRAAPAGRSARDRVPRADEAALAAPMPATVVAVAVVPGQAVRRGETLIRLEAMKMELAVTAPHDGRIRAVACRTGELVAAGVPLVAFEPEGGDEA
jgi:3-methylcrotonyl-CoA carboxylase alpha subunit